MSAYAPWLIVAAIAFVAALGYMLITENNKLDAVLDEAFRQDALIQIEENNLTPKE